MLHLASFVSHVVSTTPSKFGTMMCLAPNLIKSLLPLVDCIRFSDSADFNAAFADAFSDLNNPISFLIQVIFFCLEYGVLSTFR